ncbi:MAG TPA: hypothetical protein VFK05_20550 [Polyangiaceae bacterium]|nr:hypothetical protein [Polyangiaceae bacterium]
MLALAAFAAGKQDPALVARIGRFSVDTVEYEVVVVGCPERAGAHRFSPSELEVIHLLSAGASHADIALRRGTAVRTVRIKSLLRSVASVFRAAVRSYPSWFKRRRGSSTMVNLG